MQARLLLATALSSALLAACSSSSNSPRAVEAPVSRNDDGSLVTGVITAVFNPTTGAVPFPTDLAFSGTRDLTLNASLPVPSDPANAANGPVRSINALDGWSTVAPWRFNVSAAPRANTLVAGQSIRVFKVSINPTTRTVISVQRELSAQEFAVAQAPSDATGRTIAIVPTKPLEQLSSYMAVVTDDIKDAAGNDATPDQTYFLTQRTSPLITPATAYANPATCPSVAQSTDPLLPVGNACALEPLRLITNSHEAAAASQGIPRSEIVLTWTATTQSITPVLSATRSITTASAATLVPSGLTIAAAGLPPIADIIIGVLPVKYYLDAPTATNPTGPLTGNWSAAAGAYTAPFNALGLDPTSTHLTYANPIPVAKSTQVIPVLATVPNAASGRTKPAAGWPVVIFQHGITRNRSDALAISATMAQQGFAVIAIDQPLHGIRAIDPGISGFYIENTPFGAIANERTFDLDLSNNTTGQVGAPDGIVDASGTYTINLASLLTSRDNLRQAVADLFTLAKTIPTMSVDGDATPDFDGSRVFFVGQSLGSIVGLNFVTLEPTVSTAVLSVPGGGIAQMLNGSATFGPRIRAGLAASGIVAGTPTFDSFMGAAQQSVDSGDPINFAAASVASGDRILLHEVVGGGSVLPDQVIPNSVPGAPLSGTEPLIRALGLNTLTASSQAAAIRGAVRFVAGDHGSLLSPATSAAATVEMQTQMASMIVSNGQAVQITNTSVIRTQ
ncbi:MAG TPA: Ig-like domain-containing protein [Patescibacteria group bacterium]|nr:Ig-like domain-containing protein [Patescibacteria group bacterium]